MSVSEQLSLKQIRCKNCPFSKIDCKEEQDKMKCDPTLNDVKEWLQQFREQPLIRNTKTTNEYELNYTAGQLKMLRTLLEDLEK